MCSDLPSVFERWTDRTVKIGLMIEDDGDGVDDNNSEGDDEGNYRLCWWMKRKATVDSSE